MSVQTHGLSKENPAQKLAKNISLLEKALDVDLGALAGKIHRGRVGSGDAACAPVAPVAPAAAQKLPSDGVGGEGVRTHEDDVADVVNDLVATAVSSGHNREYVDVDGLDGYGGSGGGRDGAEFFVGHADGNGETAAVDVAASRMDATQKLRLLAAAGSKAETMGLGAGVGRSSSAIVKNGASKPAHPPASQRLREVAARVAPKKLESKDAPQTGFGEPLFPGGVPAPRGYPDRSVWSSDVVAPGSAYTQEEWDRARDPTGAGYATFSVIEVLANSASVLLQLPRGIREVVFRKNPHTKSVEKEERIKYADDVDPKKSAIASFFGETFDGCIIVLQDATPKFKGAVEPIGHSHEEKRFWVIRPRVHYDPSHPSSIYCGAKWSFRKEPLGDQNNEIDFAKVANGGGNGEDDSEPQERFDAMTQ